VPKSLRLHLRRAEIRQSTGTTNKRQAHLYAIRFYYDWQQLFLEFEEVKKRKSKKLSNDPYVDSYMMGMDAFGNKAIADFGDEKDAARKEREALHALLAGARQDYAQLEEKYADDPETFLKILAARKNAPQSETEKGVENPLSFEELADKYLIKRKKEVGFRTALEEVSKVQFWKHVFDGRAVNSIVRSEIVEAIEWLAYLPKLQAISFDEAIMTAKSNLKSDTQRAVGSTFNKWIVALRGLLKYAFRQGAHNIDLSVFVDTVDPRKSANNDKVPFSDEDLAKIFNGENYGDNFGQLHARAVSVEAKFWLPLFLLFTGCRVEELAQLRACDVHHDNETNIDYLSVSNKNPAPDGAPQKIKNRASNRPIPIHPTIIGLGFFQYLETIKDPNASLFNLKRSGMQYSKEFSKYFSRKQNENSGSKGFLERSGVVSRTTKVNGVYDSKSTHIFRHTFTTRLSKTYGSLHVFNFVMGHTEVGETSRYVEQAENERLAARYKIISSLEFPSIDFGRISWRLFTDKYIK
jgi:integrase